MSLKTVINIPGLNTRPREHLIELICLECGKTGTPNFFQSKCNHYKQIKSLPICKQCCTKQYKKYILKHKDHNYCVFLMCRLFNYPYKKYISEGAVKEFLDKDRGETPFSLYLGKIVAYARQKKITFNEFDDGETEYLSNNENNDFEITDEMRYKWGNNFNLTDYEFLNKRYIEYCRHVDTDIRSMESLIEEICHIELKIRLAREDDIDTTKMSDSLQNLLKTAGLDSKSKREMDSSDALETYGLRIKEIEENEPCEIFKDRKLFADYDGIISLIKRYIFRPLKNLVLGIKDFNITSDDLSDEYSDNHNG